MPRAGGAEQVREVEQLAGAARRPWSSVETRSQIPTSLAFGWKSPPARRFYITGASGSPALSESEFSLYRRGRCALAQLREGQ
jgi:hypothetical protein